jgi:hypothetical protein
LLLLLCVCGVLNFVPRFELIVHFRWESLNATIVDLWPISADWNYHAANPEGYYGVCNFRNFVLSITLTKFHFKKGLRFFDPPLFARYGMPKR